MEQMPLDHLHTVAKAAPRVTSFEITAIIAAERSGFHLIPDQLLPSQCFFANFRFSEYHPPDFSLFRLLVS